MNEHQGWVGIVVGDLQKGVVVSAVVERAPADQAGLKVRDVILQVNGLAIGSSAELRHEVGEHFGDELAIKLLRDREEKTIQMKVGKFHS